MKILPLNITNCNRSTANTNFMGLWGESKSRNYTESECYIYETTKKYYPFSDEKQEQIDKVVKENRRYEQSIPGQGYVADAWPQIETTIVTVMAALPFTSKEFLNYTMNRLPITKQRMIERNIINKGLFVVKR